MAGSITTGTGNALMAPPGVGAGTTFGNGGGAGPVKNLAASPYNMPLAENGYEYTNYGGVGVAVNLPSGATAGFVATFFAPDTVNAFMGFQAPAGEKFRGPNNVGANGGACVTNDSTGTHSATITVKKVSATEWSVHSAVGNYLVS
jgi:hypothetical protein